MGWAEQQWGIASVLGEIRRSAEAEQIYRAALEEYRHARGEEDKDVLELRNSLARALFRQGKYADAEAECRDAITLGEKVLGPADPKTLSTRNNLALALNGQGKNVEAETELRDVVKLEEIGSSREWKFVRPNGDVIRQPRSHRENQQAGGLSSRSLSALQSAAATLQSALP